MKGSIRWRHHLRSRLSDDEELYHLWTCRAGKSRRNRKPAPGFDWLAPKLAISAHGTDMGKRFLQMREQYSPGNPSFVVPDVTVRKGALFSMKHLTGRGMRSGKMNRLLPQMLSVLAYGFVERPRTWPTTKGFRQTNQAICAAGDLHLHERLPFGNWRDDFTAKLSERCARGSGKIMPYVYAPRSLQDTKLLQVKVMVWTALQLAVAHVKNTLGDESWEGPLSYLLTTTIDQMRRKGELVVSLNAETSLEPVPLGDKVASSAQVSPEPASSKDKAENSVQGTQVPLRTVHSDDEDASSVSSDSSGSSSVESSRSGASASSVDDVDLALLEWGGPSWTAHQTPQALGRRTSRMRQGSTSQP